jgi:hypothetical protein
MRIIVAPPPNMDAIDAVFHVAKKIGVFYCWGDAIYNPSGLYIPDELVAHEEIHSGQQAVLTPEKWWDSYLVSDQFRFDQELPAHIAEYHDFKSRTKLKSRHVKYLNIIAERLSSPLYGNMTSFHDAIQAIVKGERAL